MANSVVAAGLSWEGRCYSLQVGRPRVLEQGAKASLPPAAVEAAHLAPVFLAAPCTIPLSWTDLPLGDPGVRLLMGKTAGAAWWGRAAQAPGRVPSCVLGPVPVAPGPGGARALLPRGARVGPGPRVRALLPPSGYQPELPKCISPSLPVC